jgi:hypothetical protein
MILPVDEKLNELRDMEKNLLSEKEDYESMEKKTKVIRKKRIQFYVSRFSIIRGNFNKLDLVSTNEKRGKQAK